MNRVHLKESDLSQAQKDLRDELLAGLARSGSIAICHHVLEVSGRNGVRREMVAVVKQKRDERRLILWGCPLGAPPEHEGGASFLGDYESVLASLETRGWSDAEKRAVRDFIREADEQAAEDAAPRRRRGKHRRR